MYIMKKIPTWLRAMVLALSRVLGTLLRFSLNSFVGVFFILTRHACYLIIYK